MLAGSGCACGAAASAVASRAQDHHTLRLEGRHAVRMLSIVHSIAVAGFTFAGKFRARFRAIRTVVERPSS
jgi:hypothetical protein